MALNADATDKVISVRKCTRKSPNKRSGLAG
jgi:hypothetical protein